VRVPELPCLYCEEIVKIEDHGEIVFTSDGPRPVHPECNFRSLMGSVAHIEKRCSCVVPGAGETDPPGMTKREGARAALRAWHRSQGRSYQ
jgi:hypothetical protein